MVRHQLVVTARISRQRRQVGRWRNVHHHSELTAVFKWIGFEDVFSIYSRPRAAPRQERFSVFEGSFEYVFSSCENMYLIDFITCFVASGYLPYNEQVIRWESYKKGLNFCPLKKNSGDVHESEANRYTLYAVGCFSGV